VLHRSSEALGAVARQAQDDLHLDASAGRHRTDDFGKPFLLKGALVSRQDGRIETL
jgi:hypothetical protein